MASPFCFLCLCPSSRDAAYPAKSLASWLKWTGRRGRTQNRRRLPQLVPPARTRCALSTKYEAIVSSFVYCAAAAPSHRFLVILSGNIMLPLHSIALSGGMVNFKAARILAAAACSRFPCLAAAAVTAPRCYTISNTYCHSHPPAERLCAISGPVTKRHCRRSSAIPAALSLTPCRYVAFRS